MKRLALFVEGYTESVFAEQLIRDIANKHQVVIDHAKIIGGGRSGVTPRQFVSISASKPAGENFYVMIVNCCGDHQVKTRIIEEHPNLTTKGYSHIIGIRDLYPTFTYADIARVIAGFSFGINPTLIPVTLVLSVMEVEAWFLAEFTHFGRIHPSITIPAIRSSLGFDPQNDDMQRRPWPANDLNDCYLIGGQTYDKGRAADVVKALDFANIYMVVRNKFRDLDRLITVIEDFLK